MSRSHGHATMQNIPEYAQNLDACSILELLLCNQNLTKLVYPTLLGSDGRAYVPQLSEHLKTDKKSHKNKGLKGN